MPDPQRSWPPARAIAIAASLLIAPAAGAVVICCSFPGFFVPDGPAPADDGAVEGALDGDALVDGLDESAPPIDSGPLVTCNDGGLRAGQAMSCACGAGDASVDADDGGDAAPVGYRPCTTAGTIGDCIGCPSAATICEGATMPNNTVCVVGGVSSLGVANPSVCAPSGCALEMPEHPVALSRFFIDDHEVKVGAFRTWWNAGHVTPLPGDSIFVAGDGTPVRWSSKWGVSEPTLSDGKNDSTWLGASVATNDGAPINFVDWPTAVAFCAASGARLATEAEWEAVASGRDSRLFPREPPGTKTAAPTSGMLPCKRAISAAGGSSCGPPLLPAIDSFSADGAFDMAGSVAEWVLDVAPAGGVACTSGCYPSGPLADPVIYSEASSQRGVRGGSYVDTEPKSLRAQSRDFADLSTKSAKIGVRCVRR